MQILTYNETIDYDRIEFRVVPFVTLRDHLQMYTLVEERIKGDVVMADRRRQLSEQEFLSLKKAVNEN